MSLHRDFKGIWIPKEIWLSKNLTIMEKLFLVEIDSLDNEKGCFASNAHFALMFSLSKNRCSEIINSLKVKKYVKVTYIKKGKNIEKRILKSLLKLKYFGIRETEHPYSENSDTPIRETEHPYSENTEGNNTLTNNTKGEIDAFNFLKTNYSIRFEQEFQMKFSKLIKNKKKFIEDFNDTVEIEELKYEPRILFSRLSKYARNWAQNEKKYSPEEEIPVYLRKVR